ncbi:MAG: glutamate 5-kinase [Alphaproteobacteria bacterium]|nr:glutamate 5-kinase [Alphaproteobacteria bacterium]
MTVSQERGARAGSLAKAKRIVIKIGSSLLVDSNKNEINHSWLLALIEDVVALRAKGQDILIVSSGSVALGRRMLKIQNGELKLSERQAAAACGQVRLMQAYQQILTWHNTGAAQVLLTLADTENRQSYLNVRATLRSLLELGTVPVINENDTVATPTRRYGDNDRLAARVATMIDADCLILLSDIDGLYTADPSIDPTAQFISEVTSLTSEILAMGGESRSGFGRGGMRTKMEAARIALGSGCAMVIAQGKGLHPLRSILEGKRCSWFLPNCSPSAARKVWISGSLDPRGTLMIDDGASKALLAGRSLLSVGVKKVNGTFARGDLVSIQTHDATEVARGLVAYSSDESLKIMGKHSDQFEILLGYNGQKEIIHRDDLVLTGDAQ